jgi:hypothetical protein
LRAEVVSTDPLARFLRLLPKIHGLALIAVQPDHFWSIAMKHQRHFDTSEAYQQEAIKLRKMIGDLDRSVGLLNCDISTEEERARIFDRSDVAYPMLARTLAARRDNLRDTITALEQRLSKLDQAQPVAELA